MFTSKKAYVKDTPLKDGLLLKKICLPLGIILKNIKNPQNEVQQRKKDKPA